MSIPSWARKGVKVVCLHSNWTRPFGETTPVENGVYTIRKVNVEHGDVWLLLEEIVNPERLYGDGFKECDFRAIRFRPLISKTQEDDLKAHFYQHLHQNASRKTEERV